ncbi:Subtilisin-like protease [Acorus gramineus]|uniref:Subtilisin-like protease n=1 Tax=Acorus gramineus TaxID=55184 RepID=A0AAV9BRY4_ACOGR|nr:Subtilisin-like protease [Acorus gramineus]
MDRSLSLILTFSLLYISTVHSTINDHNPSTYIVHVTRSNKPAAHPTHHHWYSAVLRSFSPSSSLLYTYSAAAHGFAASVSPSVADSLRRLPWVLAVEPDQPRQTHTTHSPAFLGLTDDSGIWPNSDYADDVIVGVLDTGIWPERRSFSDVGLGPVPHSWKGACESARDFPVGSCNRKLIGARAFYKGYEAHIGHPIDESTESKSPRDTEGHGTHTASTAAGSAVSDAGFYSFARGEARGMASKARIAAYKICWSLGCFDSDILAAMDSAVADGVHIISLSVGANGYAPAFYLDSIAIGAFGAVENGVLVSCSAGNSGPGSYTAVNIAPWILTVGASTIDREFPADAVLGDGAVHKGVSLYSGNPLAPAEAQLPLVYARECGSAYCYMGRLDPDKVAGKIVLCDRGGNARVEKGAAVKLAGGLAMILANTEESGEELIADSHLIPATMVGQTAGDLIRAYVLLAANPTATIRFHGTVIGPLPAAPKVASFSSRGPNIRAPEILKPDVIAPGVNILAAWTGASAPTDLEIDPRRVEFNIISGTSMSCPHVSGLAALLRKAYPSWSPAAVKSALMTSAYNIDDSGEAVIGDLATGGESTPFVRGAGHVDPNRALDPGLVYDLSVDDYVAFLCSLGYSADHIAVFVKDRSIDCSMKALPSPGGLNYPSFSVVFEAYDDVVSYNRTVKNVGGPAGAMYEVKVTSPPSVEINVTPSKLAFSAVDESLTYMIEFRSSVSPNIIMVALASEFGSIEWSDGFHVVRSPIAVRWSQGSGSSSI